MWNVWKRLVFGWRRMRNRDVVDFRRIGIGVALDEPLVWVRKRSAQFGVRADDHAGGSSSDTPM